MIHGKFNISKAILVQRFRYLTVTDKLFSTPLDTASRGMERTMENRFLQERIITSLIPKTAESKLPVLLTLYDEKDFDFFDDCICLCELLCTTVAALHAVYFE